jgi:hypothetical protein
MYIQNDVYYNQPAWYPVQGNDYYQAPNIYGGMYPPYMQQIQPIPDMSSDYYYSEQTQIMSDEEQQKPTNKSLSQNNTLN